MKFIFATLLVFTTLSVFSQGGKVASGNQDYDRYAYFDAIKVYEKVVEKGYKSAEVLQRLGNSYYFTANYKDAARTYGELYAEYGNMSSDLLYRYAQSLKSVGDYAKADEIMNKYVSATAESRRAVLFEKQRNYLEEIKNNSGRYEIKNAGINSKSRDYGPAFFDNKLVFASTRDNGGIAGRTHSWDGQSFTQLYGVDMSEEGSLGVPSKFSKVLNTKYHESTPVFTKDGKTMYFTRNNYTDGKLGKDSKKTTLLKLYRSTFDGENWSEAEELPFNSDDYSCAHPALSVDEKSLYFASDMPGTKGESDIYKVDLNENGSFGEPMNIGLPVNTEGRETFPFITKNNELYVSSTGHPGLGGLDVFVVKMKEDGTFGYVQNVGEPINSKVDDFAFIINSDTKVGFFSSNREEDNNGLDDIYKFKETQEIPQICEQYLKGVAVDLDTNLPLGNAKVTLFDVDGNKLKEVMSDDNGNYDFGKVPCGATYAIRAEKEGYSTAEATVQIPNESGVTTSNLGVDKPIKQVQVGDDLSKALNIPMIYFDLDKYYIRPDAAVELAKILIVMTENPTWKVDVRSHTDCRQTAAYNMNLSNNRAKSTIAWLVKNGIDASRLTGRGYGESQLRTDCPCEPTNESSCSEEEHQLNRRSEFILVSK